MTISLADALASRLYGASIDFKANFATNGVAHPRWFALREDLKAPYIHAAEQLLNEYPLGKDS